MDPKKNVAIPTLQFEKEHEYCLSCGENITHPLCSECISKEFKVWLEKFPKDKKEIINKVDNFIKNHKHLEGKSKTCAACQKKKTYTCPYCFTEYLYNLIKETGLGVRAMSEFLFIFNFDFTHDGYSQELEAYGGY